MPRGHLSGMSRGGAPGASAAPSTSLSPASIGATPCSGRRRLSCCGLWGHTGGMSCRDRAVRRLLRTAAIWVLTVPLSPLVVLAGEPLRRYVLHRRAARRPPGVQASWRRRPFLTLWVTNPLWIALTAPARWLLDRVASSRLGPGHQPPAAGVREPRRPPPGRPSGSVALAEPRVQPIAARLLGTARRLPESVQRKLRRRGDADGLGWPAGG